MSRNIRFWRWLCIAWLAAMPAAQAQQPAAGDSEIAYRVALGRADDVKLLLAQGANPNSSNKEQIPLLLAASARKDAEALNVVQALLEGGANVNIKDAKAQTALYYAARAGKVDVVTYLLKNNIDYYSLDNNGDIARTIAYRAGRADIVEAMDNFVKGQTLQAEQTYKNAQSMIQQQAQMDAQAAEAEQERLDREREQIEEAQRLERERKIAEYDANMKKLERKVYDISYHSCAFQYWSFCLAADQTTDLTDDETHETLNMHKEQVKLSGIEVMSLFEVPPSYLDQVIEPSKKAIFDQLNAMPSRTYRRENGVGTLEDVNKRCRTVAENWIVAHPQSLTPEEAAVVETPKEPVSDAPSAPQGRRQGENQAPSQSFPSGTLEFRDGKMVDVTAP